MFLPKYAGGHIGPNYASTGVLTSTSTIETYVRKKARESNLDGLYETLKYESNNWQNGQSTVLDKEGPGGFEDSWGVCQIHLPDHVEITKEEALDVRFCVQFTIDAFRNGNADWWAGYRLYKKGLLPK